MRYHFASILLTRYPSFNKDCKIIPIESINKFTIIYSPNFNFPLRCQQKWRNPVWKDQLKCNYGRGAEIIQIWLNFFVERAKSKSPLPLSLIIVTLVCGGTIMYRDRTKSYRQDSVSIHSQLVIRLFGLSKSVSGTYMLLV